MTDDWMTPEHVAAALDGLAGNEVAKAYTEGGPEARLRVSIARRDTEGLEARLFAAIERHEVIARQAAGYETGSRYEGQPFDWINHHRAWSPLGTLRVSQMHRDIVELHQAVAVRQPGPKVYRCQTCEIDGHWAAWPCKTLMTLVRGYRLAEPGEAS